MIVLEGRTSGTICCNRWGRLRAICQVTYFLVYFLRESLHEETRRRFMRARQHLHQHLRRQLLALLCFQSIK